MEIIIKASQLILSLSILVILHELGHFIPAKLFKTRVEKFYLFFDPWFSIFKFKKNDTEYGIGWVPLGGYVKISGMIDESMDKEQMKLPAQPWEFRSKPTWQRLIIMIGGVSVNLILAVIIYIGLMFFQGEHKLPIKNLKYGIVSDSLLKKYNIQNGDKLISIEGNVNADMLDVSKDIFIRKARILEIQRGDSVFTVTLPKDIDYQMVSAGSKGIIEARIPYLIDSITVASPAKTAGLIAGDSIVAVNQTPVKFYDEITREFNKNKNKEIALSIYRDRKPLELKITPTKEGKIGVIINTSLKKIFSTEKIEYSFLQSIPAGFHLCIQTLSDYVVSMKFIFTKKGVQQMGGFGTIGNLFGAQWDWVSFWNLTAFLSVILAFMNILPIPALDGGHVMFLLYEIITGRKPNEKFMEYAQTAGMILLLGLLLFANGNDIFKLFK
ncbi:MAG: RIP metalloprotease RseP [Bacteroidota bacterium]